MAANGNASEQQRLLEATQRVNDEVRRVNALQLAISSFEPERDDQQHTERIVSRARKFEDYLRGELVKVAT